MSTSTVSINPNPAVAARRRPVEKKSTGVDLINSHDVVLATPSPRATADNLAKPSTSDSPAAANLVRSVRAETAMNREPVVQVKKPLPNRAGTSGRKAPKPKWVTVVRILTKNLLLLVAVVGFVQMIRKLAVKNAVVLTPDGASVVSAEWEGKFAEMESFVKKTTKMIQLQVDVVDRKIDKQISSVKEEFTAKGAKFDEKLSQLRENLERELGDRSKNWLTKEEFEAFLEEYTKERSKDSSGGVSLDEVRVYARQIVEKEIEKHAADGLGRVDYALASAGGAVIKHSEALEVGGSASTNWIMMRNWNKIHKDHVKMLSPSFGEAGQCFSLKGSSGFVTIRLRTAIFPEAVTLEHLAKSVAFDRSTAPKDCRIFGWLHGEDLTDLPGESERMVLLTEFNYDLEKSSAQTFNVLDSAGSSLVDMIRFDFLSNHGNPSYTCIYRLRIHGHEPSST